MVALHRDDLVAFIDALLENVFAHTPEETAADVKVDVAPFGRARFTVEDHGPGLSDLDIARGYSRTSTGLGLDIVRRTAEAAHGGLTLADRDGGGARVEVELGPPAG